MRICREIVDDEVYLDIEIFPQELEELENRKMIFDQFEIGITKFNIGMRLNRYEEE